MKEPSIVDISILAAGVYVVAFALTCALGIVDGHERPKECDRDWTRIEYAFPGYTAMCRLTRWLGEVP